MAGLSRTVCIARVGKVLESAGNKAEVEFFDGRTLGGVDLSVAHAGAGDYVEVFGNLALAVLKPADAKKRKRAWEEVRRASGR